MVTSPTPTKNTPSSGKTMNFGEALIQTTEGRKITKLEWEDKNIYGHLKGVTLWLHTNDNDGPWKVKEGDILGDDWIVL